MPVTQTELGKLLQQVRFNSDGSFADTLPGETSTEEKLLAFMVRHNTGSSHNPHICKSNVEFVQALKQELDALGLKTLYAEEEYPKGSGIMQATLVARMGPAGPGGVVLSSHTDVIPVTEADSVYWKEKDEATEEVKKFEPFKLTKDNKRLISRGAVDMKQAIVNYMAIAQEYSNHPEKLEQLEKPIYIALSWGEEIGIKGVPMVNKLLKKMDADPELIIVGEPTNEELVIGHKGAAMMDVTIQGYGGHSGYPERYVDANEHVMRLMLALKKLQKEYMNNEEYHDKDFVPPYPCINVGVIHGGTVSNAIADKATLEICIRSTSKVSQPEIMDKINALIAEQEAEIKKEAAERERYLPEQIAPLEAAAANLTGSQREEKLKEANKLLEALRNKLAAVGIKSNILSDEGVELPSQKDKPMLKQVIQGLKELGKQNVKLATEAYGTDGGALSVAFPEAATVVYGTGCIKTQNAHKPNEYITPEQLQRGPMFPRKMIDLFCRKQEKNVSPESGVMATELRERAAAKEL